MLVYTSTQYNTNTYFNHEAKYRQTGCETEVPWPIFVYHISSCIRYCEEPRHNSLRIADLEATIRVQVVPNVKFKCHSVQTMIFWMKLCNTTLLQKLTFIHGISRFLHKPKVHQHTQQVSSLTLTLSQLNQHSHILHFNAIYRYIYRSTHTSWN
jgi:hypothetical protein